ncbi:hypothetical protein EZMO1_2433 [Endozoicomonas montiporae CL-33]|uniref:Uncharacterized protein n=1 Tax=Endozoicomonas montiporae CL-33 TaxID=570277 RepID=A0A142BCP6_9GAMM|nr:hypothetical protein [Endozoicomonas montiporae]AMO56522.1 hypothetical protein EZMO1_2433 [Endozoicomonas montiporae CL-33]
MIARQPDNRLFSIKGFKMKDANRPPLLDDGLLVEKPSALHPAVKNIIA